MTTDSIDLPAYLARIGYDGPTGAPPTLATLQRVQICHACSVPFENLDVLLLRGINLDMESVQRKIVSERRGGYCFEQNGLLLAALDAMGFAVEGLSARVRVAAAREFMPARTHLFGRVTLDGVPWLVDVGLGSLTPTGPIRMDTAEPQATPHEPRRIVPADGAHVGNGMATWFHQALLGDQWQDVCEFTGERMPAIDRQVSNWWTSTNPQSKFRLNIMAAIASHDGTRHAIATREYTHRRGAEILEREVIGSRERLLVVLTERFGLVMPGESVFGIEGL